MRNLIPDQYHIYVVTGAIILCTVITLLPIVAVATRNAKRIFGSKMDASQRDQLYAKEYKAALLFNLAVLLAAHVLLYLLLGIVDTLVAFGGYVAVIGLIATYCEYKTRKLPHIDP